MRKFRLFHRFVLEKIKMLQSDWRRAFRFISQKPDFSEIWDLRGNAANGINFHYRTNPISKVQKKCKSVKVYLNSKSG